MLSKTLGKIQACAEAVLPQRAFSRGADPRSLLSDPQSQELRAGSRAVQHVCRATTVVGGQPASLERSQVLTADASPWDSWVWGAILRMHDDVQTRKTSGFFTPKESRLTQNEREALGVRYGIAAFGSVLKMHLRQLPTRELMRLIIEQDNSLVVSYIRRHSPTREANISGQTDRALVAELLRAPQLVAGEMVARLVYGSRCPVQGTGF
jgi:hypothetical protein